MKEDKHYNNYCICTSSLLVYYIGLSLLTHVGPRNPQLVPTPLLAVANTKYNCKGRVAIIMLGLL